jgi:hypothetical protein
MKEGCEMQAKRKLINKTCYLLMMPIEKSRFEYERGI